MKDKRAPLTEAQLASHHLYGEIVRYLEESRERLGLRRDEMRVLDLGCGRGEAVILLRDQGYAAVGIDIEPDYIESGRALLRERGQDESVLQVGTPPAHTGMPTGTFHYVFSDQVLEHVQDLDALVAEIARITAPQGAGFHSFPAHRHPVEDHLRMPFVHYFPKNWLRHAWILLCVRLGREPDWPHLRHLGWKGRAREYYTYSVQATYYRRPQVIHDRFATHGLEPRFVTLAKDSWRRSRLASLLAGSRAGLRFVEWALLTFRSVEVLTLKAGSPPSSR